MYFLPQNRSHKVQRIPKGLHRYIASGLQSPVSTVMGGSYQVFVSNQEQPKLIKSLTLTREYKLGGHNASWTHSLLKILWFKLSPTDRPTLVFCDHVSSNKQLILRGLIRINKRYTED